MFETLLDGRGRRRALAVAFVGILVTFAGCVGMGGGSDTATTGDDVRIVVDAEES